MSVFSDAIKGGLAAVKSLAGHPAYYRRGGRVIALLVVPGLHTAAQDETFGIIQWYDRDFLVDAIDISELGEPVQGDVIEYEAGGVVEKYEATSNNGEPCFRHSDTDRQRFRIHTKRMKITR